MIDTTEEERHTIQNNYNSRDSTYGSLSSRSLGHDDDSGYTELLRGSVPCPTCRGLGNVPKEQEDQLIALIPLKDKRLKPRRTYLWVCLAVFLCLTAAGLLVFFMFPRSVLIDSKQPYLKPVGSVYINDTIPVVSFQITNHFNVSNDNYFPVEVTGVEMTALYDVQVINTSSNTSRLEVPMRSKREYFISINVTLDDKNQLGYMVSSCKNPIRWAHEMVMLFEVTCNYSFLGHSEQTTLQTFQFVSCYSKNTTLTGAASDTKTKLLTTAPADKPTGQPTR